MITQQALKELVAYDPDTGLFVNLVSRIHSPAGKVVGSLNSDGYVVLRLKMAIHKAHRLAFLYMTGQCPGVVDHINFKKSDNRWCNLRPATRSQNNSHKRPQRNNVSGIIGVRWTPQWNLWASYISHRGQRINLGAFRTEAEAVAARKEAEYKLFGEFAPQVAA